MATVLFHHLGRQRRYACQKAILVKIILKNTCAKALAWLELPNRVVLLH